MNDIKETLLIGITNKKGQFSILNKCFLIHFQRFTKRKKGDYYNLSKFCHNASVVVKPEKGKAIMWYNHLVDEESGWMGDRDDRTLHGGCDIIKGEKWVANNWLTAPEADSAHRISLYALEDDIIDDTNTFTLI